LIEEMTPQEITDALKEIDTVVVPLGNVEQHGPHLPVGTDTFIPITVARRVAERVKVLVAPKASKIKGKKILNAVVKNIVDFLQQLNKFQ